MCMGLEIRFPRSLLTQVVACASSLNFFPSQFSRFIIQWHGATSPALFLVLAQISHGLYIYPRLKWVRAIGRGRVTGTLYFIDAGGDEDTSGPARVH